MIFVSMTSRQAVRDSMRALLTSGTARVHITSPGALLLAAQALIAAICCGSNFSQSVSPTSNT
jgi:hypothetical protein